MDRSPPDFPVHGIFQERILKWVVISYSIVYLHMCVFGDYTHVKIFSDEHVNTSIPVTIPVNVVLVISRW